MSIFNKVKQGAISIALIVIVAIIAIFAIAGVGTYNSIVSADQEVKTQLGDIDSALQRRADLIPNLVNTVKGYATHESEVIEDVTQARQNLLNASSIEEKAEANAELSNALSRLLVIVENYPDLKASESFMNLQYQLEGSENRISTERNEYNEAVKAYNTKIKQFPGNIVAGFGGFTEAPYFEADEDAKTVPEVDFSK